MLEMRITKSEGCVIGTGVTDLTARPCCRIWWYVNPLLRLTDDTRDQIHETKFTVMFETPSGSQCFYLAFYKL